MQQPSVRPRRQSTLPSPKAAPATGGKPARESLLQRLLGRVSSTTSKSPVEDACNDSALLAFPSEATQPFQSEVQAFPSEGTFAAEPGPRAEPISIAEAAASKPAIRHARISPQPRSYRRPLVIAAASILAAAALGALAVRTLPFLRSGAGQAKTGRLTIDTRQVTAEVIVDGEPRGVTPLTLSLPAGPHTLTVKSEGDQRVVPLTMAAGAEVTQYFEMQPSAPVEALGQVAVSADAADAKVSVDGQVRGASPLTVGGLTPGEHKVTIASAAGTAERTVVVTPGSTASVVFSGARASGPVGGWLSITAPFEVQVVENDDVIGTSGANRIMLAAGHHSILLLNRSLGYQDTRRIDVSAGKTNSIRVDPPKTTLSVNARPWAEIVLDGTSVGETPIANLSVIVGSHEMIFRHPQFGERKQTVLVTTRGPNRIAVDFTK